jgi:hypothetical protein
MGLGCGIVAALLVLLTIGLGAASYFFYFRNTETRAEVTGFEWQRAIAVEVQKTVRERAWEGEVPGGAREVSRAREVHHTDRVQTGTQKVKVGTRNMGNGFFKDVYEDRPVYKQDPVYRNRITYDITRWVRGRSVEAKGADQSPLWPDPHLLGGERAGERTEHYIVGLSAQGATYRLELPIDRWTALHPGQRVTAIIHGAGGLTEIAP